MRSETYMSKINLQRGKLTIENRKSREKKRICSEVSVNSPGNPWSQSRRRNGRKDLQKRKVLSLEWKSEGVMDDESGESMEPMEEVPLNDDDLHNKKLLRLYPLHSYYYTASVAVNIAAISSFLSSLSYFHFLHKLT